MTPARRVAFLGLVSAVPLAQAATAYAAPGGGSSDFGGGGGGGGGGFGGGGGGGGGGGFFVPGGGGGFGGGESDVTTFFIILACVAFIAVFGYMRYQAAKVAAEGGTVAGGRFRRARGAGRDVRVRRAKEVELAAEEAGSQDPAFLPETVKAQAADLHRRIVTAWTAPDRAGLARLLGEDLQREWILRLDDFASKGWHNITELLGDPRVEYLGLVNREDDADDRVVVRIEATLRDYVLDDRGQRINRTDEDDEITTLAEYWVLGKRKGQWILLSTEQDAEGSHHIESAIIASPWADDIRLRDEAATEIGVAAAVEDSDIAEVADLDFDGDARTAALDLASIDGRFAPDVLEAAVRRVVDGWAEAVDGDDAALEAVSTKEAAAELLHPGDPSKKTRLVVRGPQVTGIRINELDASAQPPTMTVEVAVTGRRYIQDRDTIAVLSGSKDQAVTFTERWTLTLDGADDTPWRITGSGWGPAAWSGQEDIPESLRERLRNA